MKQFSSCSPHWRESQTQEHEFQEIRFIKSCFRVCLQQTCFANNSPPSLSWEQHFLSLGQSKTSEPTLNCLFFPIKWHSRLWGSLVSSTLKINADFDHFPCFHHYHPGLRPHTLSLDDWKSLLIGVSAFVLTHHKSILYTTAREILVKQKSAASSSSKSPLTPSKSQNLWCTAKLFMSWLFILYYSLMCSTPTTLTSLYSSSSRTGYGQGPFLWLSHLPVRLFP